MLIEALEESNWNLTRAAETLGITFRSMRYNVKKYGLSREEDSRQPAVARR
jgi:two-component system response regulator PilR (NtrC family)